MSRRQKVHLRYLIHDWPAVTSMCSASTSSHQSAVTNRCFSSTQTQTSSPANHLSAYHVQLATQWEKNQQQELHRVYRPTAMCSAVISATILPPMLQGNLVNVQCAHSRPAVTVARSAKLKPNLHRLQAANRRMLFISACSACVVRAVSR